MSKQSNQEIEPYERVAYKKNNGGAPSIFSKDTIIKAYNYLDTFHETGAKIPSMDGLSLYLGISRSTLFKWCTEEDKQELSDVAKQIKRIAHELLVNNGLTGVFNASITKLMLTKHGYHDKVDSAGSQGVTINISREDNSVVIEGSQDITPPQIDESDDY